MRKYSRNSEPTLRNLDNLLGKQVKHNKRILLFFFNLLLIIYYKIIIFTEWTSKALPLLSSFKKESTKTIGKTKEKKK